MSTMNIPDFAGTSTAVEKPNANGRVAAVNSRPVALSNEDKAALDAIAGALAGALTVTGAFYQVTQPVSGTITANAGSGTMAVSLSALPALAAGANIIGKAGIDQTTDGTTNRVNAVPGSTAHALIPAPSTYRVLSAAASTNGANIKGSAGTVKGIQGFNAKGSAVYIKLYNKATAPTVGTDAPVKTLYVPASAAFAFDFGTGVAFATGIGIALTAAGADNDTTALASGDILALNVDYH